MKKVTDKTALDNAIKEAEKLDSSKYTKETWDKVAGALKAAKAIFENENATQKEIDEAAKALSDSIASLEEKPALPSVSKEELKALLDEVSLLDENLYTKDSWEQLQKALDNARTVYANEKATQKEVDSALSNLKQAYHNLAKAPSKPVEPDPENPDKPDQPETPNETDKTYVKDEVTINTKTDLGDVKLMVKHYSDEMLHAIKAEIKDKDFLSNYTIEKLLDVYFIDETGNRIVLDKAVDMTVSIQLDANMLGKKLYIVYIADDGKVTFLPSTVSNGTIQFKTTHNSKYAIVSKAAITNEETIKPNAPIKNTGANAANESAAVVFTTILVLASVSFFVNRKKKEN